MYNVHNVVNADKTTFFSLAIFLKKEKKEGKKLWKFELRERERENEFQISWELCLN